MAVRPGQTKCCDEMRAALLGVARAALDQQCLYAVHGEAEILVRSGPARRMNAGLAAQRVDHQAGIIRESGAVGCLGRSHCLDARVGGESFAAVSYTHLRAHETVLDLV